MANLFIKQAKQYSETRPSYLSDLFTFLASKTLNHDLAWDVGTGSGQAAQSIAGIYKNVVATDTSEQQLSYAPKLANIRYQQTPPNVCIEQLERDVAAHATVDLVTVAQALHWFDLPTFYDQVNWVLRRPHGVIAAWCYTVPEVDDSVDTVFSRFYKESSSYWAPQRKLIDDKYGSLYFPFKPVEGLDHTGPIKFETKRSMDLNGFFTYIRSWSAYQTAQDKGVELLGNNVIEEFARAWGDDGNSQKDVKFPIYLRIGKVDN